MRWSFFPLYTLFLSLSTFFAQAESYKFYYPLNLGDVWKYRLRNNNIEIREVVGDTLMPNGKVYRIRKIHSPSHWFSEYSRLNKDSTKVLIYNYNRPEFTFLKLDIKVGDSWKIPISSDSSLHEVVQITDTTLWFHKFKVAKILAPQPFNTKILLADSIGLLFLSNEFDTWELKEATINGQQIGSVTSVRPFADSQREALVKSLNNHPNPFNNSTAIEYWLGRPSKVRLSIFNVLGQRIKLLVDSFQPQGLHRIKWFGHNELGGSVSSGIYFYKIEINESVIVNKTLLFLK